ncbi:MAG: FHA domain-containing protein [Pseudolabrys sp.]|nr:FHA domain-containing protein [Pseudolabrys sp.]
MVTLRLIDERDPFRPTASRELMHGEMSVGRDPGADWPIDDPERKLSRIHCVFSVDGDGAVSVRDTSSNGVFSETGDRLPAGEPMPVKIGDGVRIGNFMIYVDRVVMSPLAPPDGAGPPDAKATPPLDQPPLHDGSLIEAFCRGAQIDSSAFAGQDPADLLNRLGAIYRETVLGLGQLIEDRSAARQGIDLDRTTIGASRNNPFKWAAPARVALDLLRGGNDAFMSGAEAVASSFRDMRSHVAALSGAARSAIGTTLATLDPAAIEEDVARNASLFSTGRTGASWKKYRLLHQSLVQSSEADANLALLTALRAADAAGREQAETAAAPDDAR